MPADALLLCEVEHSHLASGPLPSVLGLAILRDPAAAMLRSGVDQYNFLDATTRARKFMHQCHFSLNNKPMSEFTIGSTTFPAFSGLGDSVNKLRNACLSDIGPIPPGSYYIVDRPTGGRLGNVRAAIRKQADWFGLYAIDGNIDDKTFCTETERGNFRLHPKGVSGISKGCVVIDQRPHFDFIRSLLLCANTQKIPGTDFIAYGKLNVL